jgi:flagellin
MLNNNSIFTVNPFSVGAFSSNNSMWTAALGYQRVQAQIFAQAVDTFEAFTQPRINTLTAQTNNAMSMYSRTDIASSYLNEANSILDELGALATQANNSSLSSSDRDILETQSSVLQSQLNQVLTQSRYNGVSLFQGIPVSVDTGTSTVSYTDINGGNIVSSLGAIDLSSTAGAQAAQSSIQQAQLRVSEGLDQLSVASNSLTRAIDSNRAGLYDMYTGSIYALTTLSSGLGFGNSSLIASQLYNSYTLQNSKILTLLSR